MEQHACPATGQAHDSGAILLDRRLRDKFDDKTVTGWAFCPEVQEKLDEGYIVLVGIDEEKSSRNEKGQFDPGTVYRTGELLYLRAEVAERIFDTPIKDMAFCDTEVIDKLQEMAKDA